MSKTAKNNNEEMNLETEAADGIESTANDNAITDSISPPPNEPVIYCGPSLPKAKIIAMVVFRGGLPQNILSLIEKVPEIGKLIVPVSKLNETRKKIETMGTEENRLYQVVLSSREVIESGV
jgi:hypothetical protein